MKNQCVTTANNLFIVSSAKQDECKIWGQEEQEEETTLGST